MIITTRRHPFSRWVDRVLTLAGWFVFSYLLAHGLLLLLRHSMNVAGFEQLDPIFPTLVTFLLYGVLLAINALVLLGWSRWHHRKYYLQGHLHRQRSHTCQVGLASPLCFAGKHIDIVRQNQVVVLYHSQDGAVENVKATTSMEPSTDTTAPSSKRAELILLPPIAPSNQPKPNALAH